MGVQFSGGALRVPTYTWSGKPSSFPTGQMIFISDAGVKGSHWFYDGTRWKPVNGQTVLSTLDTTGSLIANSETIAFQYQMPAGLIQSKDRLLVRSSITKSGATDTCTWRIRVGTLGTTGDIQIHGGTVMSGTSRQTGIQCEMRLESATSMQALANTGNLFGYSGTSAGTVAFPAAATITSAAANATWVNVSIVASSTTDTVTLVDTTLSLSSSGL